MGIALLFEFVIFILSIALLVLIYSAGRAYFRWRKIRNIADSIKSSKFEDILNAIVNIGSENPTAALLLEQGKNQIWTFIPCVFPIFLKVPGLENR